MISHVDFLLRNDRLREADRWLARLDNVLPKWFANLQKRAPDRLAAMRTRVGLDATRLKALLLLAQSRTAEIKPLIDQLADELLNEAGNDPEETAGIYQSIGDIHLAVQQHPEAEHWYQLLADLIPREYEGLVTAKARQGRIDEAIQIAENAESDDSARPAVVIAKVLASSHPSREDLRLADPLLSRAVAEHPDNTELLKWVAHLRCLEKRSDDAIRLYESVLKRTPEDPAVLNNLAALLAEQPPRRKEALAYVDKAIEIAGPKPWLLDTKGTILLLEGEAVEAIELLKEATSLGSDPRRLLHLAVAYQQTGELTKAEDSLQKAHDCNLAGQIVTETDRRLLTELEEKLGQ